MAVTLLADPGFDIVRIQEAVKSDLAVIDLTKKVQAFELELDQAETALGELSPRMKRDLLAPQYKTLDKLYAELQKFRDRAEKLERQRQKEERLVLMKIAAKNDLKDAALAMRNYRVLMLKVLDQQQQIQREGGTLFSHTFDKSLIDSFSCKLIEDEEQRLWSIQAF